MRSRKVPGRPWRRLTIRVRDKVRVRVRVRVGCGALHIRDRVRMWDQWSDRVRMWDPER